MGRSSKDASGAGPNLFCLEGWPPLRVAVVEAPIELVVVAVVRTAAELLAFVVVEDMTSMATLHSPRRQRFQRQQQ